MSDCPGVFKVIDAYCSQPMDDDAKCGMPSVVAGISVSTEHGMVMSFACDQHGGLLIELQRVLAEGHAK